MAQTEHLGLHQWEATDSFLRTDFNEDFQKIDGAVGETLRSHLIRQITTTNQSSQVNVDLTGIDWSAYRSVEILSSHRFHRFVYILFLFRVQLVILCQT